MSASGARAGDVVVGCGPWRRRRRRNGDVAVMFGVDGGPRVFVFEGSPAARVLRNGAKPLYLPSALVAQRSADRPADRILR